MANQEYNPKNWFWFVGDDRSRAWSSGAKAYVNATSIPTDIAPSMIANEVELYDALARAGCSTRAPSRMFSVAEVRAALLHIDADATGDANDPTALAEVAEDIGFTLPPLGS